MSIEKQLKERWLTPEGKKVRKQIIEHIRQDNWERFLKGFPFVEEVENGKDLRGIKLNNLILRRANFEKTLISNSSFKKTNLIGSNFISANINNSNFEKANLGGALLVNSKIYHTNLKKAVLVEAELGNAIIKYSNLSNSILIRATLVKANLSNSNLSKCNLWESDLKDADLSNTKCIESCFSRSKLINVNFENSDLSRASMGLTVCVNANFSNCKLYETDFLSAVLQNSNLQKAQLTKTRLFNTNLNRANIAYAKFNKCGIYGISAWDIRNSNKAIIKDLIITLRDQPLITIDDDIELAQFIYTILNNKKIRSFINTMRTKGVLILGSFYNRRTKPKKILDKIKEALAKHNLIPIVFDFKKPEKQGLISTIKTLALLSSFVIVDLSTPAGQLVELGNLIQSTPIPFIPIVGIDTKHTTKMLSKESFGEYHWFRQDYIKYSNRNYDNQIPELIEKEIIPWAKNKNKELEEARIVNKKKKNNR